MPWTPPEREPGSPTGWSLSSTVLPEAKTALLGRVAVPRVREAVAANLRKLKELLEE
jgi:hypothetical protein